MAQETKEGSNKKGLAARILGGQPTSNQKKFFWFMILSLMLWPMFFFVSIFFFDAPIQTTFEEFCRLGMVLTIWLYPLYLLPLLWLFFRLSKLLRATWLFYLCPLIPIIVFFTFVELASSKAKGNVKRLAFLRSYKGLGISALDNIFSKPNMLIISGIIFV